MGKGVSRVGFRGVGCVVWVMGFREMDWGVQKPT